MRNVISALAFLTLFHGCSSKEETQFFSVYEKNKNYHFNLLKTEKTELTDGEYTKALLTATYLYRPLSSEEMEKKKKDTRNEVFIVGLSLDDEEEMPFSLSTNTLKLEDTAPKSVKILAKNDPRLKGISFVSEWSQFYLFTFPHTDKKSFVLNFENERYGKGKLHFAKVAKFVLTKEAF